MGMQGGDGEGTQEKRTERWQDGPLSKRDSNGATDRNGIALGVFGEKKTGGTSGGKGAST